MNSKDEAFWTEMSLLVTNRQIVIDRPKGSPHPKYPDKIYPFDYGYIEGTSASDGDGIDIWIGSQNERDLTGILCTFDTIKNDAEIKLLLACTESDLEIIVNFLGDMRSLYIPHFKEDR